MTNYPILPFIRSAVIDGDGPKWWQHCLEVAFPANPWPKRTGAPRFGKFPKLAHLVGETTRRVKPGRASTTEAECHFCGETAETVNTCADFRICVTCEGRIERNTPEFIAKFARKLA